MNKQELIDAIAADTDATKTREPFCCWHRSRWQQAFSAAR